jgi:hypothetical protein
MMKEHKLQSAMEYLMTYGWAILIIAVVLGILFQLGVFNSSSFAIRAPTGACRVLKTPVSISLVGQCTGQLPQYVASLKSGVSQIAVANTPQSLSNSISISLWVMPTNIGVTRTNPIDKRYWAEFSITFELDGAISSYQGPGPSSAAYCGYNWLGSARVLNNVWQNIVFTRSGAGTSAGSLNMYYNGKPVSAAYQCPPSNAPVSSPTPILIGSGYAGAGIGGFMSNIQVYNESLNADQVQTIYSQGIGGAPVLPGNLVGWWPLNGDAIDYSGNNNNGAPSGVSYSSQWLNNRPLP